MCVYILPARQRTLVGDAHDARFFRGGPYARAQLAAGVAITIEPADNRQTCSIGNRSILWSFTCASTICAQSKSSYPNIGTFSHTSNSNVGHLTSNCSNERLASRSDL